LGILRLDNNQLSGPIPSTLGSLTKLAYLWLYNNQLTGFPSSLKAFDLKIFPNPMSDVAYDLVTPASSIILTDVTWPSFLNTPVTLRKRQQTSSTAPISTTELVAMCPLDNVTGQNVVAGCIAGIYNRFCLTPSNPTLLAQCHDAYNRVFAASFFKSIGDVCPAWKKGPFSALCATAIKNFSYNLFMGKDPSKNDVYLNLNSTHAQQLVSNILAQPKYAPCQAPVTCSWTRTDA
jgi:hypothetical protein